MGVKVDISELTAFRSRLDTLTSGQVQIFLTKATKEMANRLLALVIPRTPVGNYAGGGTLRRGWAGNNVSGMNVSRDSGGGYSITVINPVYYASYVEYGHRQTPGRYVPAIGKRLVASWVEGQHFLKISEEELKGMAPEFLGNMLNEFLRGAF